MDEIFCLGDDPWIPWYTQLKRNTFFCEIDSSFFENFNLYGLDHVIPNYSRALDMIMDYEVGDVPPEELLAIQKSAEMLYGMAHARFINTTQGTARMEKKFKAAEFGRCPRVLCEGQPCLPSGISDKPRYDTVKIYCPSCEEQYVPTRRNFSQIDGAYFGITFCHQLLLRMGAKNRPKVRNTKYVFYTPHVEETSVL